MNYTRISIKGIIKEKPLSFRASTLEIEPRYANLKASVILSSVSDVISRLYDLTQQGGYLPKEWLYMIYELMDRVRKYLSKPNHKNKIILYLRGTKTFRILTIKLPEHRETLQEVFLKAEI